ncbi:type II toxin-antitoxin system VapC family toxin [Aureimonas mangrovi]|uniref:type II toxin-antitoxin system VapC family toxin n=1 Tax=Aureimonas mangrovi TaxID=2758041 RepID=UPI00163D74AB|nr:type II toxin-antitoxin system VapC family toxin [Aureimonas mangrovi]
MTISTLVDSNVIIDLFARNSVSCHRDWSMERLLDAVEHGRVCVSAIAWTEVTQPYESERELRELLRPFDVVEEPLPFAAAYPAGQAHRRYRERGGRRERTLPDFLIGAHALVAGHRLLTRDGSRYRDYFPDLAIVSPETHP